MAGRAPEAIFRVDSSTGLGSGHVMRCLTLADRLRLRGVTCRFVCARLDGSLTAEIGAAGFPVDLVRSGLSETDDAAATLAILEHSCIDIAVVDVYRLGAVWERAVRSRARRLLVVDDLADRAHECDMLLDQNDLDASSRRYAGLVPEGCRMLLGPSFALLREQFDRAARESRDRDGSVKHLLVSFGGGDVTNETAKVLMALADARFAKLTADVVVGVSNPHRAELASVAKTLPGVRILDRVENMASLMSDADLAIGAGGTTTWERCALGLPSILVTVADNQRDVVRSVSAAGAALDLGSHTDVTASAIAEAVAGLAADSARMRAMSAAARALCGCSAKGASAVAEALLASATEGFRLRDLRDDDVDLLLAWRNSPGVREWMVTSHEIGPAEHRAWFERRRVDPQARSLVFEHAGRPLGLSSFTDIRPGGSCEWGFYLGESCRPHGAAAVLGALSMAHAFDVLGVRVLRSEVLESNQASLGYHAKLGFTEVGRSGSRTREDGRAPRRVRFEMARDEWARRFGSGEVRL